MKHLNRIKGEQIIYDVCVHFKISPADLLKPGKQVTAYSLPRHIAMYLLCKEAGYGYEHASRAINGGAYHACLKVKKLIVEGDETVLRFLTKYRYCKRLQLKMAA